MLFKRNTKVETNENLKKIVILCSYYFIFRADVSWKKLRFFKKYNSLETVTNGYYKICAVKT